MTLSGVSASGRRKGVLTFHKNQLAAGETAYLLGTATSGYSPDTAIRLTRISMWGNTSTDGTSGTLTLYKGGSGGTAVYAATIASGTGDVTGSDATPSSEAGAAVEATENISLAIVSVGKVVDDFNAVIDFEFAD